MVYSHESFRMYAHAHPRLLLGQRCPSLIGYLHQNNLHFHFSPSRSFLPPQHLPSLENWLQMVNLKMDSKSPRLLTCQTEKGTRTSGSPRCSPPGNGRTREHITNSPVRQGAVRQKKRDWRVRGDLDLQHLALSIYITSLHKAAMDHSSQLVFALWRKAMGCHKVQAFHILPENSTALSLSHSKLMLAFEDNIFKISLSLLQLRGYFWICCCPARYTAWGFKVHLSCGTTSVHFSVNINLKSICFGFVNAALCSLKPQASVNVLLILHLFHCEWFQSKAIVSHFWGYLFAIIIRKESVLDCLYSWHLWFTKAPRSCIFLTKWSCFSKKLI